MNFNKETDDGYDVISVCNDRDKEGEIIDEINELRNCILNFLVDPSNLLFYAQ